MSPNMVVRVWESLDAFQIARKAYELVLAPTPSQVQEEVAKNAICLFLWLETIVGVKVFQVVLAMESDSVTLSQVIHEADAVHSYVVRGQDNKMPEHLVDIPAITALCGGGRLVDSRFFEFHRDLVARGVGVIRDNVAPLLFNDRLHVMLLRYKYEVNPRPAPALLEPIVVRTRTPTVDSRTAFISFPDSPPISPERILRHFERILGFMHHIERIVMEQPREGQVPKHGIIMFKSAELRDEATMNETPIFFRIDGHDMWVQLYQPLF